MIRITAGFLASLAMALSGCGGGGGSNSSGVPSFWLGGTLAGLASGRQMTLLTGAGTQASLKANGNFRLPDALPQGTKYNLTVLEQPLGQTCVVSNGSDAVGIKADVSNITIVCADNPTSLGGVVSGLPAGGSLTLANGPDSSVTVTANGVYVLPIRLASGASYEVKVLSQPQGVQCVVSNASGTAASQPLTNINVACARGTVSIGGTLAGLALGKQVQLTLTGSGIAPSPLALSINGTFTFTAGVAYGGEYSIAVDTQPAGQTCSVSNPTGSGVTSPPPGIQVTCATTRHSVGGSVTGLVLAPGGQALVLKNGTDLLTVSANGLFAFPSLLADGSSYSVTIASQPTGQTCFLGNDSGTTVSAPVTAVTVQCLSYVWRSRLVAGAGVAGHLDGEGAGARFSGPAGAAVGLGGEILVADTTSSRIRRILMPLGFVSTLSGTGVPGLINSPTASSAAFRGPVGLARDSAGNLFVADSGNHVIRRIDAASGEVTTWAGSGVAGYADGTGSAARFNTPWGLAIDANDNLYVADSGNHVVRKVTSARVVSLVAGIPGIRGRGDGSATQATFDGPSGVAVSPQGVVFVADTQNHLVRAISDGTGAGTVSRVAGLDGGASGFRDGSGNFAAFALPMGIAVDAQSNLFVADAGNHAVRFIQVVGTRGTVLTVAGGGSPAYGEGVGVSARFNQPTGLALDAAFNLYITEGGGHRVRLLYKSPN